MMLSVVDLPRACLGQALPIIKFKRSRLSAQTTVGQDASFSNFKTWAEECGVEFPDLQISEFDGIRGMVADREIEKDQVLVSLSRDAAITVEPRVRCPDDCDRDWWKKTAWYVKLALLLVKERRLGDKSKFSGYVQSLPARLEVPVNWPPSTVLDLQYKPVINAVGKQLESHDKILSDAVNNTTMGLSKEELSWALLCVRSRSFSGPYIGSRLGSRFKGAGFVAVFAIMNVAVLGGSIESTLNAVIAVALFNLLYELLLSRNASVYLLAPGVDLMNHSYEVETDLSYDYFQDSYSVRSDMDYSKGEQVFISYGKQTNDSLMQFYGFCLPDNPWDVYLIEDLESCIAQALQLDALPSIQGMSSLKNVIVTRDGFPPATLDAIRDVLQTCGADRAKSFGDNLEDQLANLLIVLCQKELDSMETTLEDDHGILKERQGITEEEEWIIKFRIEKKKILHKCLEKLR